ncbi:MAG TPA: rod shape-determining protein MreD [Thermodesulfobacteriota bacterium]|nr:rod shape-determining protein MreD [Deltaproteobacteria bacterium]HNU70673.1 rod shape-determining protein MreD [Thermodesulfobacteriota bacterium]
MIQFFLLLLFGAVCILVQSNLFLEQYVFPIKPDLTIPLSIYIGLTQPPLQACALVLIIAYFLDSASGGILGMYVFLRALMLLLLNQMKNRLFFENTLTMLTAVLFFFLFEAALFFMFFSLIGRGSSSIQNVLLLSLYQGVFTLALWIIVYPLLVKLLCLTEKARGF